VHALLLRCCDDPDNDLPTSSTAQCHRTRACLGAKLSPSSPCSLPSTTSFGARPLPHGRLCEPSRPPPARTPTQGHGHAASCPLHDAATSPASAAAHAVSSLLHAMLTPLSPFHFFHASSYKSPRPCLSSTCSAGRLSSGESSPHCSPVLPPPLHGQSFSSILPSRVQVLRNPRAAELLTKPLDPPSHHRSRRASKS
jgi:hypothetical protein